MSSAVTHRIYQGVVDAPPPPLAGALAAWLVGKGLEVRVVDPRGSDESWAGQGPLWVHLESGVLERCRQRIPTDQDLRFFGPSAHEAQSLFPTAQVVSADPEGPDVDPRALPITTYAGFGTQPGGLFRILAGRYGQPRPLPTLLREVVYLVETFRAGHLLFDDEDVGRYGEYMAAFDAELDQLPWTLTWEGSSGGHRVGRTRGGERARL